MPDGQNAKYGGRDEVEINWNEQRPCHWNSNTEKWWIYLAI